MNTLKTSALASFVGLIMLMTFLPKTEKNSEKRFSEITICRSPKGCVFKTIFGEELSANAHWTIKTPKEVEHSIDRGLRWMATAQQEDGGWGAGSHARQNIVNPHAVNTDPATTAMVGMALLRTGSTLQEGDYSAQLNKALDYMLTQVESTPANSLRITEERGTQIQSKLGDNIDAVLAIQFFSNMLDYVSHDNKLESRIRDAMNSCIDKVQQLQNSDGSIQGDGWAGVLQSSLAGNALESAQSKGGKVDDDALVRSRDFQKNNYDAESGNVNTDRGAGVALYAVSGSVRATAKEARKVREALAKAKKTGQLKNEEEVTVDVLEGIGFEPDEAMRYSTSYNVYESSKSKAQQEDVMQGFGNNGGEEFLSYLQTGESLIINNDNEWEEWYTSISKRLLTIQNEDGSWNGHHCITSPAFCTATTLLTLSITQDIDKFVKLGENRE